MSDMGGNVAPQEHKNMTEKPWWHDERARIERELDQDPILTGTDKGSKGNFDALSIGTVRTRMQAIFGSYYSELVTPDKLEVVETGRSQRTGAVQGYVAYATYRSRVTLTLPWATIVREGVGTCASRGESTGIASAIEMAWKGAASDAFKRACRTLGRHFGIELSLKEDEAEAIERLERGTADRQPDRGRDQREDRRGDDRRDDYGRDSRARRDERDRPRDRDDRDYRDRDDRPRERDRRDDAGRRDDRARDYPSDRDRRDAFGQGGDDPSVGDLIKAGWSERYAETLDTLPAAQVVPRDAAQDLFSLGLQELDVEGYGDPADAMFALLDQLKINDKAMTGAEARRLAVAIMDESYRRRGQ